jgi:hypothetical protein
LKSFLRRAIVHEDAEPGRERGSCSPGVQATAAVELDVSPVSVVSTSQPTDEVSIMQHLSETGKATRPKLLKIAKKLNWRKSPALSSMRSSISYDSRCWKTILTRTKLEGLYIRITATRA